MSMMAPTPALTPTVPDILAAFNAEVDKCKRVNYQKRTFYHPVAQIKEWMLADNNLGKLLKSVYRKQFAPHKEDFRESVIVFAILLRLGYGKWISTFQQYFHDNNLDAPLHERLIHSLRDNREVLDGFDEARWAFNPAKIEDMRNHSKAYTGGRWILPFCRREPVGGGGTATVDGVMVPEDLVPDTLKAALLEKDPNRGYEFQDKDFGLCHQFAIKSYRDDYHSVFETETSNFSGIRGLKGVVECFGWYTEETLDKEQQLQTTHNILLEYGDQDLDEYLALKYPPVLTSEIIDFWENIIGVATTLHKVHTFTYKDSDGGTEDFNGWHGDVKPSNILFAQGMFKLADFGFAKFEPKLPGKKPETSLDGVTYTYGAPECDPGRLRRKTKTPHTQKIDTWSFGCLLSSVATWVVLGSDAYQRQYPEVRKYAMERLIQTRKSDGLYEEPKALDGFHDGREILQAVKSWHQYLRNSTRRSDTVTCEVIYLIEKNMLQSDPNSRSSFKDLEVLLGHIIQKARMEREDLLPTDPEFLKALLKLDDMAPPDVKLQARLTDEAPVRQLAGLGLQSDARIKRAKKTERIEEMVIPAKVAGRRKALETELRSQNQIYTPPSVIFEPADGPSDSTLRKGAEVDHDSPPSPAPLTPQREWPPEQTPPATATEEKIQVVVESPKDFNTSDYLVGTLPVDDAPHGLGDANNIASPSQNRHLLTTTYPNTSLQGPSSPSDCNRSRYSLPPTRSTVSTVHDLHDISQYRIGQLREDLEKQWSGRGLLDKVRNKIPIDGVLKNFVEGRDIKFLVDNGWSMLEHWSLVKFVLVTLAMKIGALDDDGLDLLFTRGNHKEEGIKGSHIRSKFEAAMSNVAASDELQASRSHLLLPAQMTSALSQILADYHSNTSKKLTIIVLTTGMWEHEEDSEDVEELLAREIGNMAKDPSFRKQRRLTIEFVSFGEYEEGLTRLKNLDDNFSAKYRIPDVIDTEPWQGDPDKMLLGSINASMDKQVTPPTDPYRSDGASDYLNEPSSSGHHRNPSPGPGPRKSVTSFSMFDTDTKRRSGSIRRKIFG